ncbi:hypothetical protein HDU77_003704 [Chytriomyces hyalinus]|nr:hypothetical protein HDU77_003704 [Chytriomyces hyalinus]
MPAKSLLFLALAGLVTAQDVAPDEANAGAAVEPADACALAALEDYNLHFHIAGVFILLAVAGLGITTTMHLASANLKNQKTASLLARVLQLFKMFGIGIIAATAWMHLLPDAFEKFGNPCLDAGWAKYGTAYVGLFGLISAFATQLIEMIASGYKRSRKSAQTSTDSASECLDLSCPVRESPSPTMAGHESDEHTADLVHSPSGALDAVDRDVNVSGRRSSVVVSIIEPFTESSKTIQTGVSKSEFLAAVPVGHGGTDSICEFAHNHHNGHAHTHASTTNFSKEIATIILECGILFHSLIIGVTLGVTPDDSFTTLLVAVAFHQLFEGMALGVLIGKLSMSLTSKRLLCLMYPLTTPLGLAIGIAVRHSYNENGTQMILVQGIFNSLSAGILFYNTYTELMSEEISHSKHFRGFTVGFKTACFLAMYLGASAMAIIAIWA